MSAKSNKSEQWVREWLDKRLANGTAETLVDKAVRVTFLSAGKFQSSPASELAFDSENKIELVTAACIETEEALLDAGFETEIEGIKAGMAQAGIEPRPKDLMYLTFKLAHVGTNANHDEFLDNEIRGSVPTPIHKLVNWQHNEPNIGCMIDSKLVESQDNEETHIAVASAISKYKYPEYAEELATRFEEGRLYASMETWFDKAKCSVCGGEFSHPAEYCEHLQAIGSLNSRWPDCSRQLIGVTFAGAAVAVDRPADKQASITDMES